MAAQSSGSLAFEEVWGFRMTSLLEKCSVAKKKNLPFLCVMRESGVYIFVHFFLPFFSFPMSNSLMCKDRRILVNGLR